MVDVARHDQRVRPLFAEPFHEPCEEFLLLRQAVLLVEAGAEVPVGGVEDFHAAHSSKWGEGWQIAAALVECAACPMPSPSRSGSRPCAA